MNIVGENFPRKIVDQIKVRQEKKGSKNRNPGGDPSLLVWQNANTGWVKMISSVNINKEQRLKASNNKMAETILPGDELARKYVLFGGVYEQGKEKEGLRGGIARNGSILNDSAYGLGGSLELGLRPMPGITSFSIKTENRGSLKTATIGIKCYNRHQFDIINTLYLSLGYSVLIEWGNTMYYDNDKKFIKENPYSLADEFLGGKLKWNNILDEIKTKRLESCGNYDASLGKVVNFRWSINRDLTYDITVTVRSVGDVIESLKMNALSGYIPVQLSLAQQVTSAFIQSGTKSFEEFVLKNAAFVKQIYDRLLQNGLDDIKARGILANILSESTFRPFAYNPNDLGQEAGGLFQWRGPRFEQLKRNVPDWEKNWQGQIDYALKEDKGPEYKRSSFSTAEDAAEWWVNNWERAALSARPQRRTNVQFFPPGLNLSSTPQSTTTDAQPFIAPLTPTVPQNQPWNVISQQTQPTSLDNTSVENISKYAYTHDVGALFYNTMIRLNTTSQLNNNGNVDAVKIDFNNGTNTTPQYYIRLGYFLQLLEDNIIYKLNNKDETPSKIIKFDYETDTNIILLYGRQLSANPNVCIFKRKFILVKNEDCTIFPELNDFILEGSGTKNIPFYGKIMNVYFNMSYVLDQMEANKNGETGVLTLIDLLKILTQGFCKSTGNYNKIEPTVDEESNIIKFIDDLKLPTVNDILKKLPTGSAEMSTESADFKMYGYYATNPSQAGIVRDLNFTTTVSPNLATMITIGAQANGYVTGQDSTALSVMNYGLVDRVKEEWIEPTNPNTYPQPITPSNTQPFIAPLAPQPTQVQPWNPFSPQPQQNTTQTPQPSIPLNEKYKDVIVIFNKFIQNMKTYTWNQDDVNAFSNSIQSFAEYNQAEVTLRERQTNAAFSSPSIGFLPFDITLTIDGLSGMKVYQKYITDTDFLPSNYPSSLEFLIKGITHEIKDNQWVTTLESIAVPKNPFGGSVEFNVGERVTGQTSPTQARAGEARPTNFTTNANYSNVRFQNIGLGNPSNDRINNNLLKDISIAAKQVGVTVSITTAVSGHKPGTRHASGNAVDIAIIDGIAVNPRASNRNKIDAFVAALQSLGYVKNTESGQAKAVLTFGFPNHNNHIHVSNKA